MRKFLILLIGGLVLGFCSSAFASLEFSSPYVPRSDNRVIEVGATATIRVIYTNDTGGEVEIDAAKLYIDYESNIIDAASPSPSVANLHTANFTVNEYNIQTPGSIRYQLRTELGAGQTPLSVANGNSVDLIRITFHAKQSDALFGTETYFIRFTMTDRPNNVQVADSGNNKTGLIIDPIDAQATEIHLEVTNVPNFGGLNSVIDAAVGNTVDLYWTANENAADDKKANAETLYPSGTKLRYNLYRSDSAVPPGDLVNGNLNAITYKNGPGTGVPGSGMEQLSDCKTYYYTVRGRDNCTPTRNEEGNTNQLSVVPHDYTAPAAPTGFSISPSNEKLTLNWTNPGVPDFGGVVVIRKLGGYATPTLSDASGNNDGTSPPDVNTAPPEDPDAIVVYKGTGNSFQDTGLNNGTVYNYSIYAYDRAVTGPPREQGYNWSLPAQKSAAPGVAPTDLQNFLALSSVSGLALRWNNPPQEYYGGALVVGTTNLGAWATLTTTSHIDDPDIAVMVLNQPAPETPAPGELAEVPLVSFGTEPLDMSGETIYYFKAFAFNLGDPLDPASESSIAAHQFSPGVEAGARVGGAAAGPITYNFKKIADGLGLNDFAILHDIPLSLTVTIGDKTETVADVYTIADFVSAIHYVKPGIVTAIGWLEAGQMIGYYVTPDGFVAAGANIPADATVNLTRGRAYQISVMEDVSIVISGM